MQQTERVMMTVVGSLSALWALRGGSSNWPLDSKHLFIYIWLNPNRVKGIYTARREMDLNQCCSLCLCSPLIMALETPPLPPHTHPVPPHCVCACLCSQIFLSPCVSRFEHLNSSPHLNLISFTTHERNIKTCEMWIKGTVWPKLKSYPATTHHNVDGSGDTF